MEWRKVQRGLIMLLGLAGTGKTTTAVKYYLSKGYKVKVLTANNNTARALTQSLGVEVQTIASGAFINNPPVQYYVDFKDLSEYDVIIIDEALLAGTKRVFDLAEHLMENHIVVICTDENQMLPDLNNEGILYAFRALKEKADAVEYFTTIYRTSDPETQENYRFWYDRASKDDKLYFADDLRNMFDEKSIDELEFSNDDMWVCVANNGEQFVVDHFHLSSRGDIELIPKGAAASQTSCNRRMPILTQNEANELGAKEYYGYAPVSSIVRAQGKTAKSKDETKNKKKNGQVYMVMEESSATSDKGIYTTYTRIRHHDDFHVVIIPDYSKFELDEINGLPVKNLVDYQMNKNKAEIIKMGDDMPSYIFNNIKGIYENDTDKTFYNKKHLFTKDKKHVSVVSKDCFVLDKKKYTRMSDGTILTQQLNPKRTKWSRPYENGQLNINPYNLAKKMTPLNYVDEVYSICAEHHASLMYFEMGFPKHKERCFEFDLRKGYHHAFYLAPIPMPGVLSHEYNADMLNWYFVNKRGSKDVRTVTERYAKELAEYDMFDIEFAFATPYKIGCLIGDIFKEMLQTKEGTDEIYSACRLKKETRIWTETDENGVEHRYSEEVETEDHYYEWGWFMKNYIEKANGCYVRNTDFVWELMINAVRSEMMVQTIKASKAIKGVDPKEGINADAFYFDTYNDEIREKIESALDDGWDFRINSTEPVEGTEQYKDGRYIVYQNFSLETKAERKKRLDREKAKERRAKKKAEKKLDNEQ